MPSLTGERARLYQNLASGAESGWDFSTRWLAHSGSEAGQLASIMTDSVVPVDLNAILCANEASLSRLFRAVGEVEQLVFREHPLPLSLGIALCHMVRTSPSIVYTFGIAYAMHGLLVYHSLTDSLLMMSLRQVMRKSLGTMETKHWTDKQDLITYSGMPLSVSGETGGRAMSITPSEEAFMPLHLLL